MGPIDFLVQKVMLPFLNFSYHTIYPNYGIAIILLTVLIKVLFYPLTRKQFESMKVTQKLQPKMKELQEKFKGQPEKLQKEMIKLWRENKANPLSGCLPALVQLPVFFAVFYTVNSAGFKEILGQPGINAGLFPFWLADLALPDKTFILPVIIALSTYWSQKMFTVDPKQASLFIFMPFLMFFISLKMPAGVLLYWAASQLISTLQQLIIMKRN